MRDTQHPLSWEKIQILETPVISEEIEEVVEKEKPRFLTQLESATDIPEGAVVHLEAVFQPARDPELKVFVFMQQKKKNAGNMKLVVLTYRLTANLSNFSMRIMWSTPNSNDY